MAHRGLFCCIVLYCGQAVAQTAIPTFVDVDPTFPPCIPAWVCTPSPTPTGPRNICDVFPESCRGTPPPTFTPAPTVTPIVDCVNEADELVICPTCWADQDHRRTVTVDELLTVIANVVHGCPTGANGQALACWGDINRDGRVIPLEVQIIIGEMLDGCPEATP